MKRSGSRRATIGDQRKQIALALKATPSLKIVMRDPDWRAAAWLDARSQARKEARLPEKDLPETCPWTMEQAVDPEFWPE